MNRIHTLRFRPEGDPAPDPEPVVEVDLEEVIGGILDKRGLTSENMSRLEKIDLLDGLEDLFKKHKAKPGKEFDSDGFLKSVEDLLDTKLRGIGSGKIEKKSGWLTRILTA